MKRLYLFCTNQDIETIEFENLFKAVAPDAKFQYESATSGYFESEVDAVREINSILRTRSREKAITVVAAHRLWPLEKKLLTEAQGYFPNQCVYLTDVLLKEIAFGDPSSTSLLGKEFNGVPKDLLETAGAFLRNGLNALETAKSEGIHRNTFNYRLNSFIELTGLDIRDYHNALLLELYFQLSANGK